ncbi:MAG TPA: 30S ribosomal protein S16 [Candidatus Paceibacterota bacterium]|nr:30S ribosomal protein S16 [Candidatus Paceibacterota bacterium]
MLSIRLQRVGRTNDASFRVVLTDSKNSAKSGKFKEILGTFAIKAGKATLKTDRINYWINNGARPTDTMHNLLIKEGIIEGKKRNVLSKKAPTQKRKELKKK